MTLFFSTPGFAEEAEKKSSGKKEEAKTIPTAALLKANPAAGQSPAAQEKEVSLTAGWDGSHPYIRSTDGNFLMRFGGRMQLDYRGYTGAGAPTSTFLIRRARFTVDGNLYKNFEYIIQADFADTGSQLLRDAFLHVTYTEKFQVKAGHFKSPFSQEKLQSSKYIDFVEHVLGSFGRLGAGVLLDEDLDVGPLLANHPCPAVGVVDFHVPTFGRIEGKGEVCVGALAPGDSLQQVLEESAKTVRVVRAVAVFVVVAHC